MVNNEDEACRRVEWCTKIEVLKIVGIFLYKNTSNGKLVAESQH